MEFPSICYEYVLLPLVNKEAALTYGRAEYNKVGNSSRDRGGKKAESGDAMEQTKEKNEGTLPVVHSLMAIHRLIEIG